MRRFLLAAAVLTFFAFAGVLSTEVQAQYPQRGLVIGPQVVIVSGGSGAYGNYGVYGYGNFGYSPYGGYRAPYYPPSAPYGAGYSGGYQPYQQMYNQRLYYGLGF